MTEPKFYTRPFKLDEHGPYVYDSKNNMVFQFEKSVHKNERKVILFRLNSIDLRHEERIQNLKLTYDKSKTRILDCEQPYIDIRGWGNLNGIGGHNLGPEIASQIQDEFAEWLIQTIM